MGAEDEVDGSGRPLEPARSAIATLVHVLVRGGWSPRGPDVEQVHEEVVGQRLGPVGKHAVFRLAEVGERDLLAAGLRAVEILLDPLEALQHFRQADRFVGLPIFLWRKADARSVRASALVRAAEARRAVPGSRGELPDGQTGSEDL